MATNRIIYEMHLETIIDHTEIVRELFLKTLVPNEFKFKAGQFAMLHVPTTPKPTLRAYSIASTEERKDGFRLLFKYVPNGIASNFVWSLKGGEILQFTGPFGRVFFKDPPAEQIVFLNTGTGLAQHYSYLMSKKKQFPHLKYKMLFGLRTEADLYYQKELEDLKKELPNFEFEYVLSRPSEQWKGKKGYVQNFITEIDYKNTSTHFYLCGNSGMIKDVKRILIEENQFEQDKIFSEAFD